MATRYKKAFVTGAAGFVGRHLVRHLAEDGWQVQALVRREGHGVEGEGITVVVGDVLDSPSLQTASVGADVFFHLAAQASVGEADRSPGKAIQLNVTGTLNAIEACRVNGGRRFIYLSTIHVMGSAASLSPDREATFDPQSVYASSKLAAERLARAYGRASGIEVVVLRPSNVYGPEQSTDAVIPEFVARALRGEPIEPRAPEARRHFLYVDDLVNALMRAAVVPEAADRAINILGADSVSIGDVAAAIESATATLHLVDDERDLSAGMVPQPPDSLLGWSARVSLREGIARTVAAAAKHADIPSSPAQMPEDQAFGSKSRKVSIIIPVYNGSDYLAEAIDSALAQTYANLEVVVVNDGSTDDGATASVAARYGTKIRYIEKLNGGVASALNEGLAVMKGELFSWLSHDDVYHPTKIEDQVRALIDAVEPHVIFCDYEYMSKTGEQISTVSLASHQLDQRPLDGLLSGRFNGCTFLIPRQTLLDLGGFKTGLPTTQDYELWFRMSGLLPFLHVPQVLVKQRLHPMQSSRSTGHLTEADRLMVHMLDRTPVDTMVAYDGSMERFLLRTARTLARSPYSGAAAYSAFRARQALWRIPHTVVIVLKGNTLEDTIASIVRCSTRFTDREWVVLTPDHPADDLDLPNVTLVTTGSALSLSEAIAVDVPAKGEFVHVGFRVPQDQDLLVLMEELIFCGKAAVSAPAASGETGGSGWLLRMSRRAEATRDVAAASPTVHPPEKAPHPRDRTTIAPPLLPDKSLAAMATPASRTLLDMGFRLLRFHAFRRLGVRLIRHVLRRAGLGHVIDPSWYRASYGLKEGRDLDVWMDYLISGWSAGREPNPWFHGSFYAQQTMGWDGKKAPLFHFLTSGAQDGLLPHPRYAIGSPDISAYVPPQLRTQAESSAFGETGQDHAVSMLAARFDPDRPTVLLCLHCWGGGTLTHARELAAALAKHANVLFLFGGDKRPLILSTTASDSPQGIAFDAESEIPALAAVLGRIGIDHVDVHHAVGFEAELEDLLARLALPYDVTLVDYHLIARQPHFSGRDGKFVGDGAPCVSLLREKPAPIYANAARRIAISRDMAFRLRTLRPEFEVIVAAHWLKPPVEQREVFPPRLWDNEPLRVLVFGPIADHKGWDILVRSAESVVARGLRIEFHVLGASEMGKPLPTTPALINHGWFTSETLSERIGSIAPHVAWYPTQAPETWCYALDDGMVAELPIVASAIGALIERCHERPATWLLPHDSPADAVVDLFEELRSTEFAVKPMWYPTQHLPPAEPFYFDAYLAPARRRKARHPRGN